MQPRLEYPGVIVELPAEIKALNMAMSECGTPFQLEEDGILVLDENDVDIVEGGLEWLIGMRKREMRNLVDVDDVSQIVQYMEEPLVADVAVALAVERLSMRCAGHKALKEWNRLMLLQHSLRSALIDSAIVCSNDVILYEAIISDEIDEGVKEILTNDE